MASYPSSFIQDQSSREEWRDPMIVRYSRAGTVKARRLQEAKTRVFIVEHKNLTTAQRDTLETFYDTNRAITLSFAWNFDPGTVYTVIFADPKGLSFKHTGNGHWNVSVELAEVT